MEPLGAEENDDAFAVGGGGGVGVTGFGVAFDRGPAMVKLAVPQNLAVVLVQADQPP